MSQPPDSGAKKSTAPKKSQQPHEQPPKDTKEGHSHPPVKETTRKSEPGPSPSLKNVVHTATKATRRTIEALVTMKKDAEQTKVMGECGIPPDQKHLVDVLLHEDPKTFDFGGFLRQYFSPSLRTFAAINFQGRYRGTENTDCVKTIDLEKMASKEDADAAQRNRNLERREQILEGLKAAALDDEHFEFLKGFANMQPVTFPLTISHELLQETVPMLDEIFHFYVDHLGNDHKCTIEAGEHFVRHRNRLNMYDNL